MNWNQMASMVAGGGLLGLVGLFAVDTGAERGGTVIRRATESAMMTCLFGDDGAQGDRFLWNLETPGEKAMAGIFGGNDSAFSVEAPGPRTFRENGKEKRCLVTVARPEGRAFDGHGAAPLIGVAIWEKRKDGWGLQACDRAILKAGSFGEAPEVMLTLMGPEFHGLLIEGGFTNQGYTTGWACVVVPWGDGFKEVLRLETHGDNAGAAVEGAEPYGFGSKLRWVPGEHPVFDDLVVEVYGSMPGLNGGVELVELQRRFCFDGDRYREAAR